MGTRFNATEHQQRGAEAEKSKLVWGFKKNFQGEEKLTSYKNGNGDMAQGQKQMQGKSEKWVRGPFESLGYFQSLTEVTERSKWLQDVEEKTRLDHYSLTDLGKKLFYNKGNRDY